jgi:hypothetical protein
LPVMKGSGTRVAGNWLQPAHWKSAAWQIWKSESEIRLRQDYGGQNGGSGRKCSARAPNATSRFEIGTCAPPEWSVCGILFGVCRLVGTPAFGKGSSLFSVKCRKQFGPVSRVSANPKEIESISAGLRGTSYPGRKTEKSQTLKAMATKLRWIWFQAAFRSR